MKLWKKMIIGLVILLILALAGIGNYFYNYAFVPGDKNFLSGGSSDISGDDLVAQTWYTDPDERTYWEMTSEDNLDLSAIYLPAETDTNKTVLIAHGYMGNNEDMFNYARMYHEMGYNVLAPDARGHGESEGEYVGFGWDERKDYLQWINQVIEHNGADEEIVLFGVSMGGATVMMTSGEALPDNVKAIVEDCGYSSVEAELSYQLDDMFGLPAFPIIPVTNLVTKVRAGYFFSEASSVEQLAKNTTPILFIHGDADTFVPFSMLDDVYNATDAPKEKYVVEGAPHAGAYASDPEKYQTTVANFLENHL